MYQKANFQKPPAEFGPIQIVHDFEFVALNLDSNLYAFLQNSTEEERKKHVAWRIRRLKERGYAGLVLSVDNLHYLENEESLRRMAWAVDYAYEQGMRIWLYDEQYYPTGAAGGLVLRNHPEMESMALACVEKDFVAEGAALRLMSPHGHSPLQYAFARNEKGEQIDISSWKDPAGNLCWDAPSGKWHVWCFFMHPLYEGTPLPAALRAARRYPSVCDMRAMKRFLDVTYTPYEKFLGDRLGTKIEAVFTDEPSVLRYRAYPENRDPDSDRSVHPSVSIYDRPDLDIPIYPFIAWPYGFEEAFQKRTGYSLAPHLPELFSRDFQKTETLRRDFYETLAAMFDHAYNDQFARRIHINQLQYTGHHILEETFSKHPSAYGNLLHNLGRMDIPGCDLLWASPDRMRHSLACKLASSAAHQYGKKSVMIEASNMWDSDPSLTIDQLKLDVAMIFALGVNIFTSYFGEELFNEKEYQEFATYTARLGSLFSSGTHETQVLMYYPYEQIASLTVPECMEINEQVQEIEEQLCAFSDYLLSHQVDFDFMNQEVLLQCDFQNGEILTPCGEHPRALLFPAVTFVDKPVARAIQKALNNNVRVIFGGKRQTIRGLEQLDKVEFTDECGLPASWDVRIESEKDLVAYHYQQSKQNLYLLVNTNNVEIRKMVNIPNQGNQLKQLDLSAGTSTPIPFHLENGRTYFDLVILPQKATVIVQE